MTAYLNIGSNLGDRHAYIAEAVRLIAAAFPEAAIRVSAPVESEPWGFESSMPFINIGVSLDFHGEVDAHRLLEVLQHIEREVSDTPHRNADGSYRDRCIDIDIIAIDCLVIDTPTLTLPHPRAHLRPFVMEPLRLLATPEVVSFVKSRP